MAAKDYIRWIRSKVGQGKIILAFAGGCIFMTGEKSSCSAGETVKNGDFPEEQLSREKLRR